MSKALSRRTVLFGGSLAALAVVMRSPAQAITRAASSQIRALARLIEARYPRFYRGASVAGPPRAWPHLKRKKEPPVLRVDGWLLPASVATWVIQDSEKS